MNEERIREEIARLTSRCYSKKLSACPNHPIFQPQKFINLIFAEVKGIRLEADNQDLPENYHNKASLIITYNAAQQDMLKDGWVKCKEGKEKWGVKPVNKEEHCWKDTVIDISYASRDDIVRDIDELLSSQAKFTWPIAEKAGIQKVVEHVENNINEIVELLAGYDEETRKQYHIAFDGFGKLLADWIRQAFLKEVEK